MSETIGSFGIEVSDSGVAIVSFRRPPVNAVSISVYEDLGNLVDRCQADNAIRVVVLRSAAGSRAWCGGADLNDFVGIDAEGRRQRYEFINATLPRFYHLARPVIAAIDGAAIGIGMILAALCDMRVASEEAIFACPEIDYGLVAGGAALFAHRNMPDAIIQELLYTGTRQLQPTGFFNYVLPADEVHGCALELAEEIAAKSLPAIRARKMASANLQGRSWEQAYLDAQQLSGALTGSRDGEEGVLAFLEGRRANYCDL